MNELTRVMVVTMLAIATMTTGGTAAAQAGPRVDDAPGAPGDPALREAIEQHFVNRLRAELGLTDRQMADIEPLVRESEAARRGARAERGEVVRALRRGLRGGASDGELRALLDRLDDIEQRLHVDQRAAREAIEAHLTVRQQVQFRFFVTAFRRELERRVADMREGGGPPPLGPRRR